MADATSPPETPTKTWFERFGPSLPIGLAALATAFAGLSSGEMSRAMFWRSAAAQDQARATSQWTLAGFKRDRAIMLEGTATTLRATGGWATPEPGFTATGPTDTHVPPPDERIHEVLDRIKQRRPDAEVLAAAARVPADVIGDAIRAAHAFDDDLSERWKPVIAAADAAAKARTAKAGAIRTPPLDATTVGAAVHADRYALDAVRNRNEASVNQDISRLYEVRVQVTTAESDRHRRRSENFFYAMLVGQIGATGSSLALGRQQKSALWTIAGVAGLAAVGFGGYVYLTM